MHDLSNLLNNYFSRFYKNKYKIYKEIEPDFFISHSRIDVVIKAIYVEYYLGFTKTKLNKILYYLHLKRWNNFAGEDSNKSTYQDYITTFHSIIDTMKEGFDSSKSLIPVDENNKIIDGSHRLGSSIVLKKKVKIIKFDSKAPEFTLKNLDSFFNLKKNDYILDFIIINYVKYDSSIRFIVLFPIRDKIHDTKCLEIIKNSGSIVLRKSIGVGNLTNAFHMIKNFYFGAKWIGNLKDKYAGAQIKAAKCFRNTNGIIDVLLFKPHKNNFTIEHLKKIKEEIRKYYDIGFHSIHSSDNHEEAIRYSKLFFNNNSQKYLSCRSNSFFFKLERLLEKLNINKFDHHHFAFSGSSVMAALGLKDPKDFDAFYDDEFILPEEISSHNKQIIFLKNFKINELIYNPKNYFYYMGYKFVNLNIILELKKARYKSKPNKKDHEDIKIINNFLLNNQN